MITIKKQQVVKSTISINEFRDNLKSELTLRLEKYSKKGATVSNETIYFEKVKFNIGRGQINEVKNGTIKLKEDKDSIVLEYWYKLNNFHFLSVPVIWMIMILFLQPSSDISLYIYAIFFIHWAADVLIVIFKMKFILDDSIQIALEGNEKVEISEEQMKWINDSTRCPACGCKIVANTDICPDCGLALS